MKKFSFLVPLTCAAIALAPFSANAADEGDAPPPPRSERGPRNGPRNGPRVGAEARTPPVRLTQEEQTKLRAALAKLRENKDIAAAREAVQKAQKSLQEAQKKLDATTKAAVVKVDPSLEEVVKKYGDRPLRPSFGGRGGDRQGGPRPEGFRRRGPRGGNGAPPPPPPSADNL
jgi:hypothetical protein